MLMHKCESLLSKLPVLANASEDVLYSLMYKLQFEVYFPEDIIFHVGQYIHDVLFWMDPCSLKMNTIFNVYI